jgi:hypothetical protein
MSKPLAERETHLNMCPDNRGRWEAATDDPVMQKKFKAIGAKLISVEGDVKFYELKAEQLLFRAGKRKRPAVGQT